MTDTDVGATRSDESTERTGWVGWLVLASVMMLINGGFGLMAGLVALFRDQYYLVRSDGLVVSLDYTVWDGSTWSSASSWWRPDWVSWSGRPGPG